MKLTTKWLIEKQGCPEGVKWFKRNYPDGMTMTKKNISELVGKLLRKKKIWDSEFINELTFGGASDKAANILDVCESLDWLLWHCIKAKVAPIYSYAIHLCKRRAYAYNEFDKMNNRYSVTQKQIVEAFWEGYKK